MGSRPIAFLQAALLVAAWATPLPALAQPAAPFEKLAGRWVGEGRLGIRDGRAESVKCRVTYVLSDQARQARQTIRCASASGHVEVQSTLKETAGVLSGIWQELTREWSGELSGTVTPLGFKVAIKGTELSANMDVIVKDNRQVIEIQFNRSTLIGLTLVLRKG